MKTGVLITAIVFFLVSCKNSTEPVSETFTNASKWIYSDTTYDPAGKQSSAATDTVITITSTVANSQKTLVLSDSAHFILNESGSTWMLSEVGLLASLALSPFPGKIGDTVFVSGDIPTKVNGNVFNAKIIITEKQTGANITVPAGVFTCVVYESDIWNVTAGILWNKQLISVSGTTGIIQREYINYTTDSGQLYSSENKQLLKIE
jgi:hypothetical protein